MRYTNRRILYFTLHVRLVEPRILVSNRMVDLQIRSYSKFTRDRVMPIHRMTLPLLPLEELIMLPKQTHESTTSTCPSATCYGRRRRAQCYIFETIPARSHTFDRRHVTIVR